METAYNSSNSMNSTKNLNKNSKKLIKFDHYLEKDLSFRKYSCEIDRILYSADFLSMIK